MTGGLLTSSELCYGEAHGHTGEWMQGALDDESGRQVIFVVTMHCQLITCYASLVPDHSDPILRTVPNGLRFAARSLQETLCRTGGEPCGGQLTIRHTPVLPFGHGFGQSTMDTLAAARTAARMRGMVITPDALAKICIDVEGACDSTMYPHDRPLIYASRRGYVVERLPAPFPPLIALTLDVAPPDSPGVETLSFRPRYGAGEMLAFRDLRDSLHLAAEHQDPGLLAEAATRSLTINQGYNPTPGFADLLALARKLGCPGLSGAHTGTCVNLLFHAVDPDSPSRAADAWHAVERLGFRPLFIWNTQTHEDHTSTFVQQRSVSC